MHTLHTQNPVQLYLGMCPRTQSARLPKLFGPAPKGAAELGDMQQVTLSRFERLSLLASVTSPKNLSITIPFGRMGGPRLLSFVPGLAFEDPESLNTCHHLHMYAVPGQE